MKRIILTIGTVILAQSLAYAYTSGCTHAFEARYEINLSNNNNTDLISICSIDSIELSADGHSRKSEFNCTVNGANDTYCEEAKGIAYFEISDIDANRRGDINACRIVSEKITRKCSKLKQVIAINSNRNN